MCYVIVGAGCLAAKLPEIAHMLSFWCPSLLSTICLVADLPESGSMIWMCATTAAVDLKQQFVSVGNAFSYQRGQVLRGRTLPKQNRL